MFRLWVRLLSLCALLAILTPVAASPAGVAGAQQGWTLSPEDETAYIASINEVRVDNGLTPLSVDPDMTSAARDWSIWMIENSTLQHADDIVTGAPTDWMKVGENVGRGPEVPAVWDAFLASPAHKANVLDPVYTLVGVGVVWNDDGRHYTTHRFASVVSGLGAEPAVEATSQPEPSTEPATPVESEAPAEPTPVATSLPTPTPGESTPLAPGLLPFGDLEAVPPPAEPERLAVTMAHLIEAGR